MECWVLSICSNHTLHKMQFNVLVITFKTLHALRLDTTESICPSCPLDRVAMLQVPSLKYSHQEGLAFSITAPAIWNTLLLRIWQALNLLAFWKVFKIRLFTRH